MEIFFVASKIRAVQIRAMENRASRGMPVIHIKQSIKVKMVLYFFWQSLYLLRKLELNPGLTSSIFLLKFL